jgi:hypothetical protein
VSRVALRESLSLGDGESVKKRKEKRKEKKGNPEKYDYFLCEATEKMSSLLIVLPCVKDQKEEKNTNALF